MQSTLSTIPPLCLSSLPARRAAQGSTESATDEMPRRHRGSEGPAGAGERASRAEQGKREGDPCASVASPAPVFPPDRRVSASCRASLSVALLPSPLGCVRTPSPQRE